MGIEGVHIINLAQNKRQAVVKKVKNIRILFNGENILTSFLRRALLQRGWLVGWLVRWNR